jgi:hypothetical protein
MGTTLVIARETLIKVYDYANGMFEEVGTISFKKPANDDTIVQYVTALSYVVNNGQKPAKTPPKRKTAVELLDEVDKKKAAKKTSLTPIQDDGVLFKTIVAFDEWRTTAEAHDIADKYSHKSSFGSNVKRAKSFGWLIARDEPIEDRLARNARGRISTQYKLSEAGKQKVEELREKAKA